MNPRPRRSVRIAALIAAACGLVSVAWGQSLPLPDRVDLPRSVPDPLEPLNRAVWVFNQGTLVAVIQPTSRVYRLVVAKPVRTAIGHFGKNLTYPGRLINNLLQGKWAGARDESYRFACNTTVGVAGFFDVAGKWKIPKSDADFGQTFGRWGWEPGCFLMLPFLGPSNERDVLGLGADTAANPLIYISPYHPVAGEPLTYLGPYTYLSYAVMYNDLSDSVDELVRFARAEPDPYSAIQYAWTFARASRVADFRVKGARDEAALETIESVFVAPRDPQFPGRGKNRSARIAATGHRLGYTFWLQPRPAPIVYILPGLGGHRLSQSSLALAELAFGEGCSVVSVSSAFNPEFMANASTADMPAYLPVDGHDVHVALTEIDRDLDARHPHRLGSRALMGYSMGGFHALYIAATGATNRSPLVKFDRFVAVSSPVRLLHGATVLDGFYQAPLDWPAAERSANLENTFLKAATLARSTPAARASLPFGAIESRFLIGLTFRRVLRDVIYSSQSRHPQGILSHPLHALRREPAYQEIMDYSYQDYFSRMAIPYYRARGREGMSAEAFATDDDLRTYEAGLRAGTNIRVVANRNDFLLSEGDLAWLQATFPGAQLTLFEKGGHLGNLSGASVQAAVSDALAGLGSSRPEPGR